MAPARGDFFLRVRACARESGDMISQAAELAAGQPLAIVIEVPSGRVHTARHGGGGAGLSVYGFAAGVAAQACVQARDRLAPDSPIYGVTAERWTGGHGKDKRQRVAARRCPWYSAALDPGGDEADAICLADWFAREGRFFPGKFPRI